MGRVDRKYNNPNSFAAIVAIYCYLSFVYKSLGPFRLLPASHPMENKLPILLSTIDQVSRSELKYMIDKNMKKIKTSSFQEGPSSSILSVQSLIRNYSLCSSEKGPNADDFISPTDAKDVH